MNRPAKPKADKDVEDAVKKVKQALPALLEKRGISRVTFFQDMFEHGFRSKLMDVLKKPGDLKNEIDSQGFRAWALNQADELLNILSPPR